MSKGNVFDYMQDSDIDPCPLVRCVGVSHPCASQLVIQILGIANGLHYLHTFKQGPIIHGDVKGVGILVSKPDG